LRRVPFTKVEEYEPLVARSFPLNEDFLDKQAIEQRTQSTQERQGTQDMQDGQSTHDMQEHQVDSATIQGKRGGKRHANTEKEHRADIEVHAYAGGCRGSDQINYLLDVTVSGIHAITNVGKAGVPGGVANMAQIRKDKQCERFDHDGRIIAFAFDSEGGACDSVVKFIYMIYAKPKGMSIWDTEGDRMSQKKTLIDTLSSVLAKHRARDKIFMGLK